MNDFFNANNIEILLVIASIVIGWLSKSGLGKWIVKYKKVLTPVVDAKDKTISVLTKTDTRPDVISAMSRLFDVLEVALQIDRSALIKKDKINELEKGLDAVKALAGVKVDK